MAKKAGSSTKTSKAKEPKDDKENDECGSNDKKVVSNRSKKSSPSNKNKKASNDGTAATTSIKENRKRKAVDSMDKKEVNDDDNKKEEEAKPKAAMEEEKEQTTTTTTTNDASSKNDDNDDGEDSKPAAEADTAATRPEIDLTRPIKRARTPYFIFSDERRAEIQAKHKGEGVAVVARELGQMWSKMSAKDKEVYQEKAAMERDHVAQQLAQLQAAGIDLKNLPGAAQSSDHPSNSTNALIFPLARMRKIVKLDPEVKGLSKEALLLVTKCTELMTGKLGIETVRVAQIQNRRKLLPDDIANVTQTREQFLFLRDDVKDFVREQVVQKQKDKESSAAAAAPNSKEAKAASNSKPLTAYFAAAKGS